MFLWSLINVPLDHELNNLSNGGNPFKIASLLGFLSEALGWGLTIGALIVFFMIIWAGLQWFYAGEDSSAVNKAKARFTNSLLGFSLLASSYAVVLVIQYFFGLTIFQQPGTSFSVPNGSVAVGGTCTAPAQCVTGVCYPLGATKVCIQSSCTSLCQAKKELTGQCFVNNLPPSGWYSEPSGNTFCSGGAPNCMCQNSIPVAAQLPQVDIRGQKYIAAESIPTLKVYETSQNVVTLDFKCPSLYTFIQIDMLPTDMATYNQPLPSTKDGSLDISLSTINPGDNALLTVQCYNSTGSITQQIEIKKV